MEKQSPKKAIGTSKLTNLVPRFYPSKIKEIVKKEVDRIMEKEKAFDGHYTDEEGKRIAADISDQVRNATKSTADGAPLVPRHKIVVQTVIGEKTGQGLKIASKSLWHSEHDNSATYTYETVHLIPFTPS